VQGSVAGSCECGNGSLDSMQCSECLDQLHKYQFLKDSAPCCYSASLFVMWCTVYHQNPSSRNWARCIKSPKDITGTGMATDRKSWQRITWLLLPSLYTSGM